jgi:hypothetical protein
MMMTAEELAIRRVEEEDIPLGATNAIRWNGAWVVKTKEGFQVLDVDTASMRPLQLPGLDALIALAGTPGGSAWALGRVGKRLKLLRGQGSSFQEQPLLENRTLAGDETGWGWALLAEGDTLIVVDPNREEFHALQGGAWRKLPFTIPSYEGTRYPNWSLHEAQMLLRGSILYVGFNVGEWGGGLYTLSLQSGEQKDACPQASIYLPIVGLAPAPDGRLWFAEGLSHLGAQEGRLWRLDADGCTLVTGTQEKDQGETPWNLEPTSFEGLALDSHGEPHILGWDVGVARRQGQGWTVETLDWLAQTKDFTLAATQGFISPFWPTSLALEGETALIGTNQAGLLLWRLNTREMRQALVPK